MWASGFCESENDTNRRISQIIHGELAEKAADSSQSFSVEKFDPIMFSMRLNP
jgi:hypothetical protein